MYTYITIKRRHEFERHQRDGNMEKFGKGKVNRKLCNYILILKKPKHINLAFPFLFQFQLLSHTTKMHDFQLKATSWL